MMALNRWFPSYTEQFVETMNYFRAIMKKNEKSERALKLTGEVIAMNAANYTAWHYRRLCLFGLKSDLKEELKWTESFALSNAKNYQLWHHRRILVETTNQLGNELEHTEEILKQDAKNYHAWSHRQWVLKTFNAFKRELEFVASLIENDIRNNSAWNQRHFVVDNTTGFTEEAINTELGYTFGIIRRAPNNESPWNYIIGLLNKKKFTQFENLEEFALDKQNAKCSQAHMILVELYEKLKRVDDAVKICEALSTKSDVTRSNYWKFRASEIAGTNKPKSAIAGDKK